MNMMRCIKLETSGKECDKVGFGQANTNLQH